MMLQADRSLCIRASRSQKAPGADNWLVFLSTLISPRCIPTLPVGVRAPPDQLQGLWDGDFPLHPTPQQDGSQG